MALSFNTCFANTIIIGRIPQTLELNVDNNAQV